MASNGFVSCPERPSVGSSGDLLADRRYQWGAGALKERDFAAAADLFQQAAELAPEWAPPRLALGDALMAMGDTAGAQAAWRQAARLDPARVLAADLKLAAAGAEDAPAAASREYVRALFDEYAPRFEAHLRGALAYRGPELLAGALERACALTGREFRFVRALDLGCGSGLMAAGLSGRVDAISGCDLSPKMIETAQRAGRYSHLQVADICDYLAAQTDGGADLVISADVFIYLGDLDDVFARCARAIPSGGLFAFTVQRCEGTDWVVGADLRYAHSRDYIERLAAAHCFSAVVLDDAWARKDAGREVPGLVVVLSRA